MIWSTKLGNEIYVYRNGELIYKRWLDQDTGRVIMGSGLNKIYI